MTKTINNFSLSIFSFEKENEPKMIPFKSVIFGSNCYFLINNTPNDPGPQLVVTVADAVLTISL